MAKDSSPVQQLPKHVQLRAHAGTPATQHVAPHVECGLMLVSLIHFENAIRVARAPVATVPLPSDLSGFQGFTWTHALRMLPGSQPLPLKFVPSAASAAASAHCPAPARPLPHPRLRQPHNATGPPGSSPPGHGQHGHLTHGAAGPYPDGLPEERESRPDCAMWLMGASGPAGPPGQPQGPASPPFR